MNRSDLRFPNFRRTCTRKQNGIFVTCIYILIFGMGISNSLLFVTPTFDASFWHLRGNWEASSDATSDASTPDLPWLPRPRQRLRPNQRLRLTRRQRARPRPDRTHVTKILHDPWSTKGWIYNIVSTFWNKKTKHALNSAKTTVKNVLAPTGIDTTGRFNSVLLSNSLSLHGSFWWFWRYRQRRRRCQRRRRRTRCHSLTVLSMMRRSLAQFWHRKNNRNFSEMACVLHFS